MRNNNVLSLVGSLLLISFFFYSCQKSIDKNADEVSTAARSSGTGRRGMTPYKFERINRHNFDSQGWKEQQVNIAAGVTVFSDSSDLVEIVCGPKNGSDPRLIPGCITMNLPTSADPTLRRIRLRRGGYSGTRLADLTELKYSTYVVNNAPTIMVLQVDVTGDDTKDFNIFFSPTERWQGSGYPPVLPDTWQQWDALQGTWHYEAVTISGLPEKSTIGELVALYPGARIIDTTPEGHNGEGVRFTIGGNPRSDYDNTVGYFDALIIGTRQEQHSTLYDFMCDQSGN
ncbi:MAG TPA: hypothetical protein VFS31_03330 [Chitinophagaceae bacterium]|nr:hypothetical protein [Chitinophagaceae bacterium]